jgi:hypothetical protein
MTTVIIPSGAGESQKPLLCYQNLLEAGDVVASSENASFPIENAYDWLPYDFFKPAASGVVNIDLTLPTNRVADYLAFYAQDVWGFGGTIRLLYHDGSGYVEACGIAPSGPQPVVVPFTEVGSNMWRIEVSTSDVFSLGCISFGKRLELAHGTYLGQTPPQLARATRFINSVSDAGVFLGRSVLSQGVRRDLVLNYATDEFTRTQWLDFVKHAERKPFFFVPNSRDRLGECMFAWVDGDINPPTHTHYGFMGTSITLRGVVE